MVMPFAYHSPGLIPLGRRAALAAFAAALSSFACSAAAVAPPASKASSPRTAALFYSDVQLAPGRTFSSPLVRGTVHGHPTTVVVDTGAQVSVIDAALAVAAGLEVGEPAEASDPSGTAVPMRRADRSRLGIEGLGSLAERPTAVIALPPILTQLGVGAIVSPQALVERGHRVVLDLANAALRIIEESSPSPSSHGGKQSRELPLVNVCRFHEGGFDAKALVVEAVIDGCATVMELDTGASGTFVVAESEVGRKLGARADAKRTQAMGAAGEIEVIHVGRVPANIGSVEISGPMTVMPGTGDSHCGYEGRIGIDQLRSCILDIGETSARVRAVQPPDRLALSPVARS